MRTVLNLFLLLLPVCLVAGNEPKLANESTIICPSVSPSPTTVSSVSLTLNATQVVFDFYFISDYENGIGANHDHYFSASVDANVPWELAIYASSDLVHNNGMNTIPINQVGIEVDLVGNYGNGDLTNNAKNHPKALQLTEYKLLEPKNKNKSNAGDDLDNAFIFYWEMGTDNGNMNSTDFQTAGYAHGIYQTTINFILREVL
ncbi:MAG: hypothetical protein K9H64_04875 [Bacteroidales bacterium]|nr:hypothetical protein [Bacteroidales bacterium]MCF8455170.1 hypothetical protein [Bacteroidales bacterium]